jgi:hypothetical protein
MAIEARREDAGVIQNQKVVRAEQVRKVAEVAIIPFAGRSLEMEQAGSSPVGQRLLGD